MGIQHDTVFSIGVAIDTDIKNAVGVVSGSQIDVRVVDVFRHTASCHVFVLPNIRLKCRIRVNIYVVERSALRLQNVSIFDLFKCSIFKSTYRRHFGI